MRSAFVVAAFAAGALAVPLMEREVVWETDVVYATQYVTVTAGDVAPTAAPPAYSTSSEHWGHRKKKTSSSSKSKTRSKPKPTSYSSTASSNDSPKDSPKATSSSSDVEEAAKETAWAYSWSTSWSESAPAATSAQEQAPPAYTPEKSEPAPTSYDAPKSYSEAPTSTKASSSSNAKPTGYQGMVLHHHNIHRQNHSAPDIAWSDSLAATAQKIGETCVYAHNQEIDKDQGQYGQNIAAGVEAANVSAVITELFYNGEVSFYDELYGEANPSMDNFHEWGHFSQIVWKGTTEVGCATVDCSAQKLANTGGNVAPYFTVCNYKTAGNMGGAYAENIEKPRGDATCYWNDGM